MKANESYDFIPLILSRLLMMHDHIKRKKKLNQERHLKNQNHFFDGKNLVEYVFKPGLGVLIVFGDA